MSNEDSYFIMRKIRIEYLTSVHVAVILFNCNKQNHEGRSDTCLPVEECKTCPSQQDKSNLMIRYSKENLTCSKFSMKNG